MGELAGTYGNGRRMVQSFCASVLQIPISLGAIQKVLDRVTKAIEPHYTTIATQARQAPVNYIDETPWLLTHTLQWLGVMATAPPTGGEWRAWYTRLCHLIDQYHARRDDAGRFAHRLLRELDSLWVFLAHCGVDATSNRAERALRCGVLWRKRSLGTASEKGNRWVERILSLRETCRLRVRSTYTVLVDALTRFFQGHHPDLSWITEEMRTATHPL